MRGFGRTALSIALGIGFQTPHPGVAPWDFPDAPLPRDVAAWLPSRPEAPSNLIAAAGMRAALPDGIAVEVLSVGRRSGDFDVPPKPALDASPVWKPDGSPYLRPDPEKLLRGYLPSVEDAKKLDDHGARYLTFRLSGRPGAEFDVGGYVPGQGAYGQDAPFRGTFPASGTAVYRTRVMLADRAANRYRLAVAAGEWETATKTALSPKEATGRTVLLKGEWGTLWQDASELDRLKKAQGYSGPGPRIRYWVEAAEPRAVATRLRFLDAQGNARVANEVNAWNQSAPVQVAVEARPLNWVEFSDVRYDPQPALWPNAYWAQEGEKAEVRAGTTVLRAVVDPEIVEGQLLPTRVYAPDGKLWRAFPDPQALAWPWIVEKDMPGNLLANLRIDSDRCTSESWALIEAFASETATPNVKGGEPLGSPLNGRGDALIPVTRPSTPFIRFRISYPHPWTTVGEIAPPTEAQIERLVQAAAKAPREQPALFVSVYAEGHAEMWDPNGVLPAPNKPIRWKVKAPGTQARVIMRFKSGERRIAQGLASPLHDFTRSGGPWFVLNEQGVLVYGAEAASLKVPLKEIAAFEIETQDYDPPVDLIAKVPARVSHDPASRR